MISRNVSEQFDPFGLELFHEKNNLTHSIQTFIDSMIEGVIIFDENRQWIGANEVALKLFGYNNDEIIQCDALTFIAPQSKKIIQNFFSNHDQEPFEAFMLRKSGTIFPAIIRGNDIVFGDKNIRILAILDMTVMKEKEKEILKLAHYDRLTELPNQLLFRELFEHSIIANEQAQQCNALLFIDLDHFKAVNDAIGHRASDQILIEAAKRIRSVIHKGDIVTRFGGDEFVVLIHSGKTDRNEAINHIEVIAQKILAQMQMPYLLRDYDFRLTASIGIAVFKDKEYSHDDLMKYGSSAMYSAKANGRNNFQFFDPELQKNLEEKVLLVDRLRKAIEGNCMSLYYQNQILVNRSYEIVGVEVLVRWNDNEYGVISPANFIPIAEESGLIIPLGKWILCEAMKQLKRWEVDPIKKNWRISVNVSYKQFEKDDFVSFIESMVCKHAICAKKLRLELTESLLIKNTDEALSKIYRLKELGLSLSIDDFGTGYSSLSYLKQLPIDELKIDQSFIRDLINDSNDEIIVQTIISIGQKFGLEVIAEGVESREQYERLAAMGCEYFQGYFFGRPVCEAEL